MLRNMLYFFSPYGPPDGECDKMRCALKLITSLTKGNTAKERVVRGNRSWKEVLQAFVIRAGLLVSFFVFCPVRTYYAFFGVSSFRRASVFCVYSLEGGFSLLLKGGQRAVKVVWHPLLFGFVKPQTRPQKIKDWWKKPNMLT